MKKFLDLFKFRVSLGKGTPIRDLPKTPSNLKDVKTLKSLADLGKAFKKDTPKPKFAHWLIGSKKIKIAVDESIGSATAKKLSSRGYKIVCKAGIAEPDDVWMKRALAAGALFIVSPDLDIPSMIERENYPMVWIDFLFASEVDPFLSTKSKDQKREVWAQYVHDRIEAKIKFLGSEFGVSHAKGDNT